MRSEACELREQMDSLAKLIDSPDRNFNAIMERMAALLLHQAAFEEGGDDAGAGAGDSAGDDDDGEDADL